MVPAASNLICFVLSPESAITVDVSIRVLLVSVSVVARPTSISVVVGKVRVPVPEAIAAIIGNVSVLPVNVCTTSVPTRVVFAFGTVNVRVVAVVIPDNSNCIFLVASPSSAKKVVASVRVLLVNVSVVARPISVSDVVGNVRVPVPEAIAAITGNVSVLLVNVDVVVRPINVSVVPGKVNVILVACVDNIVVVLPVVPDASKLMRIVLSLKSAIIVDVSMRVLLVSVSVVARPINVSVELGKDNVPVFKIVVIIGDVNVLFVSVCAIFVPTMVVSASGTVNILVVVAVIPDS